MFHLPYNPNYQRVMSLRLFPYLLGHVCNLPFDQVDVAGQTRPLMASLRSLLAAEQRRLAQKEALVAALLPHIEAITERETHKRLYSIRRELYNERPLRPADLTFALETLPPILAGQVAEFVQAQQQERIQTVQFEAAHATLSRLLREQLQQRVTDEAFKKALVFASHSLLESIQRYRDKPVANFVSKEFGLETTLLKYYTRMGTKASPFSQFTSIFWSNLAADQAKTLVLNEPANACPESVVLTNRSLLSQLTLLLSLDERTCTHCTLYLNPSVQTEGQHLTFLTCRANKDHVRRLVSTPETTVLRQRLCTGPKLYTDLLATLATEAGLPTEQARQLLNHYLDLGLLEPDLGPDATNPDGLGTLRERLLNTLPASEPMAQAISTALTTFSLLANDLRTGSSHDRQSAQKRATNALDTLRAALHACATGQSARDLVAHPAFLALQPHQYFFEDTYRPHLHLSVNRDTLHPIAGVIQQLLGSHAYFDENALPRHRLYEAYTRHFSQATTPVLTAYGQYRTLNAWSADAPADGPTDTQRARRNYRHWLAVLRQAATYETDTITLTSSALRYASTESDLHSAADLPAASAFVQLFREEQTGTVQAVLNSVHTGFGKMGSRFLHQLPKEVTNQLITLNSDASTNALLCELDDATHSNANVHPALLPYRLTLAGHQQAHRPGGLCVTELALKPDPHQRQLQLVHIPTQRPVCLYDLGTVLPTFRSPLFAFLSLFAMGNKLNIQPFLKGFYQPMIQPQGISVIPRLVLNGRVVVQRRAWHVPTGSLPPRETNAATFFRQVNRWRLDAQLPDRVFVFVQSKFMYEAADLRNLNRDDAKPQFIDFTNPMLVGLFAKLAGKCRTALLIEEMLPDAPQLTPLAGRGTVSEYLLQWYNHPPQTSSEYGIQDHSVILLPA